MSDFYQNYAPHALSVHEFKPKNKVSFYTSLLARFSALCLLSFPKIKMALKWRRYSDITQTQAKSWGGIHQVANNVCTGLIV